MNNNQTQVEVRAEKFLSVESVRRRYDGVSRATIWRWSKDTSVGFPTPIYIAKRPFWRLDDLIRFEEHTDRRIRSPKHKGMVQ